MANSGNVRNILLHTSFGSYYDEPQLRIIREICCLLNQEI